MAHEQSALTYAEKVSIRSSKCLLQLAGKKITQALLKDAVTKATGFNWENDPDSHEKLAAARTFRGNLSGRRGVHTCVPVRFGCSFVPDVLSQDEKDMCKSFLSVVERIDGKFYRKTAQVSSSS